MLDATRFARLVALPPLALVSIFLTVRVLQRAVRPAPRPPAPSDIDPPADAPASDAGPTSGGPTRGLIVWALIFNGLVVGALLEPAIALPAAILAIALTGVTAIAILRFRKRPTGMPGADGDNDQPAEPATSIATREAQAETPAETTAGRDRRPGGRGARLASELTETAVAAGLAALILFGVWSAAVHLGATPPDAARLVCAMAGYFAMGGIGQHVEHRRGGKRTAAAFAVSGLLTGATAGPQLMAALGPVEPWQLAAICGAAATFVLAGEEKVADANRKLVAATVVLIVVSAWVAVWR